MRLQPGNKLVLASHNKGKLVEMAALLAPFNISLVSAGDLGLEEPEETAPDFAGNARLKATKASSAAELPALSDDSGFCVAALNGAPGVLSARWAGASRNFASAMQRVHDEVGEQADRRAWFICALSLAWPDGRSDTYVGRVDGTFCWPPAGTNGFGYDPVFRPLGASRTFGEMTTIEKEADSHRARAMAQLTAAQFR